MIKLISKECIGQCAISRKRKRLVDEVEVFESVTKRPRNLISNEPVLGGNEQIFSNLSEAIDGNAIQDI